jgi:TetR/AcrR family transcriptional regulator, transcriptional repressor for nem operon
MSKPTSSVSTAISIRIDNDLLQAVIDRAIAQGSINTSGRMDKRGKPNLSAAISDLLKLGLEQAHPRSARLSDSVSNFSAQDWDAKIADMEKAIIDRVCETISQQLQGLTPIVGGSGAFAFAIASALPTRSREPENSIPDSIQPPAEVEQTKNTKERILEAAARGFRTKGYSGIGIDTLAKEAGVTSGAFYGHFRSKEDAFLESVVAGLTEFRVGIGKFQSDRGKNWIAALVDYYFGKKHRDNLEQGCALPIFSPEVIRADGRVRFAYQTELLKLHEAIAAGLTIGDEIKNHDQAWILMSLLVGGVTLSRAVRDENLADLIAAAVHEGALSIGPKIHNKMID